MADGKDTRVGPAGLIAIAETRGARDEAGDLRPRQVSSGHVI